MRRVFVALALTTVLAVIAIACGFDLEGTMDPLAPQLDSAVRFEASLPDGEPVDAGIDAPTLPEIPIGGGEPPLDAGADATVGDCGALVIADYFNTDPIGPMWMKYGPVSEQFESGGNGFVRLIPTGRGGTAAGLFTVPAVTASSFVAKFRFYAETPGGGGSVGDGLTFSWISSGVVNQASLADAVRGAGLGVPRTLGGVAFALDSYANSSIGDPSTPAFSLLHLEPAKGAPGGYDWHFKNTGPYNGIYDAWRTVTVTLDKGKVSADVNGQVLFSKESVTGGNIAAIGFTAATGGSDAIGFNVDSLRIDFKDAVCP